MRTSREDFLLATLHSICLKQPNATLKSVREQTCINLDENISTGRIGYTLEELENLCFIYRITKTSEGTEVTYFFPTKEGNNRDIGYGFMNEIDITTAGYLSPA